MKRIRTGTVGYSYRDWAGVFYPQGALPRRQLAIYSQHFNACELTQFTHQMPDGERLSQLASQIKSDLKFFVRIHNAFTHCADIGLALTIARHFRKALEPLYDNEKLGGLIAPFPYAFKRSGESCDYLQQLSSALNFNGLAFQVDFRHPSWFTEPAMDFLKSTGLGLVCVDEPQLPGLVPPVSVGTAKQVVVRLHGRNAESWWSGNATTRYDYFYNEEELNELHQRYQNLWTQDSEREVCFLFQNHWQAQAVRNAARWKEIVSSVDEMQTPAVYDGLPQRENRILTPNVAEPSNEQYEDDTLRPPTSLPLSEVKTRVTLALSDLQPAFDLPHRDFLND